MICKRVITKDGKIEYVPFTGNDEDANKEQIPLFKLEEGQIDYIHNLNCYVRSRDIKLLEPTDYEKKESLIMPYFGSLEKARKLTIPLFDRRGKYLNNIF
jgi:hypothetical protein